MSPAVRSRARFRLDTSAVGHEEAAPVAGGRSVLADAVRRARADRITDAAAALSYYAFVALPALLLAALGAFTLLAGRDAVAAVSRRLERVAPPQAVSLLEQSLDRTVGNQGGGVALLAAGLLLALWTATGAAEALMRSLNAARGCTETRGFVRRRLTALRLVALGGGALLLVFGLLVLGPHLSRWVGEATGLGGTVRWIWWTAEWPVLVAGLVVAVGGVLSSAPDLRRRRLLTLGAAVSTVGWLAASALFSLYVSRFGSYDKTWGSLSAVIVTLVWLWIGSLSLLFGAEVDAAMEQGPRGRK